MSKSKQNSQSQPNEPLSDGALQNVSGGEKTIGADPCAAVDPCAGAEAPAGQSETGEKGWFKYKKKKKFFGHGHHH